MESIPLTPREYHARRDRERLADREALREEVLERTRQAILRHAPRFPGIRAVYLFGSLVQPGRFTPLSDVDVAVDTEDIREETPFWRALEEDLERNVACGLALARWLGRSKPRGRSAMSAKWVLLESSVRDDLQAIERLYKELGHPQLDGTESEEDRIVIA